MRLVGLRWLVVTGVMCIATSAVGPMLAVAEPATRNAAPTASSPDLRGGLPLPPGTRSDAQGQLISSRGLRDTSDFFAKALDQRGIAAERIGPMGGRGVELTRFVSDTPATPWLAIHVLRSAGKTLIFFVQRPKSATTP